MLMQTKALRNNSRSLHSDLGPRPPRMPRPAIDLKHIRENPGLYETNCIQRNYPSLAKHPWRILELHEKCRVLASDMLDSRRGLKQLDGEITLVARQLKDRLARLGEPDETCQKLTEKQERLLNLKRPRQMKIDDTLPQEKALRDEILALALDLPNLTSNETPDGQDAEVLDTVDHARPSHDKSHEAIGSELQILNLEAAASLSGWGFYYLIGAGALLEQALIQHAMSIARSFGFTPIIPPSLVYSHAAWACGFQPRDEGGNKQVYTLEQDDPERTRNRPQLALTGTAEIPLAGLYMNHIFKQRELPLKHVGVSRCYRAEAGSRGRDTKGLYRVHEFTKVELFAWTAPDGIDDPSETASRFSITAPSTPSQRVFKEMLEIQKQILSPLGIPLRILNQPASDLGASATIKYDIEGYFPSRTQAHWGELSSLSNCTDYQTRRLDTKLKTPIGHKWPYTLNGTALAVPRVIAAILENNWDEARRVVVVPECLRKWMDGIEVIDRPSRQLRSSITSR